MRKDLPISPKKNFKYSITFQSFDEESLEIGETDVKGYEVEETTDTIGEILYEANTTYGIYMPVSFGYWESTEPEENRDFFEKGIRKYYALHITNEDGTDISQEESDFISFLLSDGRFEINKFRDYAVGGIVLGAVALGVGALITYFYFKGKKPKKDKFIEEVKNAEQIQKIEDSKQIEKGEELEKKVKIGRAKSVTHTINGKDRKFPIKDAWKREHSLENKSQKYEVSQGDRKPVKYEMGGDASEHYYEVEYGEGGVARAKDIIMNKIGYNEDVADYFVSKSEKFAIWLADAVLKKDILYLFSGKKEEYLKSNYASSHRIGANYGGDIRAILDWLQHPITPKQDLKQLSFDQALEKAREWHQELQVLGGDIDFTEPEKNIVLKKYPVNADGVEYYWVFIPSNYCDLESSRMGHCGRTGYGNNLISLRSVKPYGKGHTINDSHVTIAYGVNDGLFYQVKGKKNNKPSEKYFPFIFDLIKSMLNNEINKSVSEKIELLNSEIEKINKSIENVGKELALIDSKSIEFTAKTDVISLFVKEKNKLERELENIDYDYNFNGFASEYASKEDYGWEDMTNEEIKELYELNPSLFDNFAGKYILYEAGLSVERPNTTIVIEKSAEYVSDLLKLDRDLSDEVVEKVLTGETHEWFDGSDSFNYYYDNASDYVNNLNKINYEQVIDKIVEITGLDKSIVQKNGAKSYLEGDDEEFDKDNFDDIRYAIARALTDAEEDGYVSYYYKQIENALSELGTIKKLTDEGVELEIDLENLMSISAISSYLKDLETESLVDVFFEAESQGEIEFPELSIDDRYTPSSMDFNEYFDIDNYEKGGSLREKTNKKTKVKNMKPSQKKFAKGGGTISKYELFKEFEEKIKNKKANELIVIMKELAKKHNLSLSEYSTIIYSLAEKGGELNEFAEGGSIETIGISKEDYFLVVQNWVYFTFNYPMGFVKDAFNSNHLEEKFSSSYERYGSVGVLMNFWANLDAENRRTLSLWIKNNYFNGDKTKLQSISDDNYAKIITHWNMFCFNYPYGFVKKVFNNDHYEVKFTRSYEKAGSTGAVNNFFTELSGDNQKLLTDWVFDNYKGETFKDGGRVTTNDGIIEEFLSSERELKVGNLSTHFNKYDNQILLRNYGTLIATRKGNDVEITNTKYSKTTTIITNKVKNMALRKRMNVKHVDKFADGGEAGEWSVTDVSNAEYLGVIEFEDNEGEFHNFEIMETDDRLVFGGMTNSGFIESGYIEKDGFSTDETLQSLLEDLEVYYNDGAEYTSQIVFNQRMAKGGQAGKKPLKSKIKKKEPKIVRQYFEDRPYSYAKGGSVDMNKHIWEGWTIGSFIEELEPQFNMINSGRSWQKPFKTRDEVKKWAMDNQPYYKKYIPEVVDYFWTKSQNKNYYKNGGEAGEEKPYQVYNNDTQNVEGYFDNEIEAEEFASQFKNASVYDTRYADGGEAGIKKYETSVIKNKLIGKKIKHTFGFNGANFKKDYVVTLHLIKDVVYKKNPDTGGLWTYYLDVEPINQTSNFKYSIPLSKGEMADLMKNRKTETFHLSKGLIELDFDENDKYVTYPYQVKKDGEIIHLQISRRIDNSANGSKEYMFIDVDGNDFTGYGFNSNEAIKNIEQYLNKFAEGGGVDEKYIIVDGTAYSKKTPKAVIDALELARRNRIKVKLYYGDIETGKDWVEEYDTIGTIGRSTGTYKVPLLIKTNRSYGGGSILDSSIVKIVDFKTKRVLYQNPKYKQPKVEIVESDMDDYAYNTLVDGKIHGRHKSLKSAQMLKSKIMSEGGGVDDDGEIQYHDREDFYFKNPNFPRRIEITKEQYNKNKDFISKQKWSANIVDENGYENDNGIEYVEFDIEVGAKSSWDMYGWINQNIPSSDIRIFVQDKSFLSYAKGGSVNDDLEKLWIGYASAILFAERDSDTEEPLDGSYSISDFDAETVKSSKALIRKFYNENKKAIKDSGLDLETIGSDIWYARAGHGAGFFDHNLDKDIEDKLKKGAKSLGEYPSVETYDGKISVRGGRVFSEGGSTDLEYSDILNVLKSKIDDSIEEIPMKYENSNDFTGEEVEHESRDGFIPYTDGGYEAVWFEQIGNMFSTGYNLPNKPLDDEMNRQINYNLELAKESFIEKYPELVEELGEENIDYHSLNEAGYSDEAEELSEMESDNMFDDGTIMMQVTAYYYSPENVRGIDDKHTIRLFGDVNLESPYHRQGNLDDSYDIDFTFDSIAELEEKMDAGLKEIISWFDGDMYDKSTTEMKIRRMAKGGSASGQWIIQDWAGNHLFRDKVFDSFEEGWDFIYENVQEETEDDGTYDDYYVVELESDDNDDDDENGEGRNYIVFDNFIKKYENKYGYKPSKQELNSLYTSGELSLTDEEEDELIKYFDEYAEGGNIKGMKLPKDAKIRINYVEVSVYKDSYEEGETENVNNYDLNHIKGSIVSPKELVPFLAKNIYTSEDSSHYVIIDNNIHTSQLQDADGSEASKRELEEWKKGNLELYSANFVISVSIISEIEFDDETLSSITGIGIYKDGGVAGRKSKKTNKKKQPKIVRQYFEDRPYSYAKGGDTNWKSLGYTFKTQKEAVDFIENMPKKEFDKLGELTLVFNGEEFILAEVTKKKNTKSGKKNTIKDWYIKNYPTDDLGEELNEITFEELWNEDYKKYNIYQVMGVADSVIRERLFEHLAEIKGVTYGEVYRKLFSSEGFYAGGGGVKIKSAFRLYNSPLIKFANFKDGSHINLMRLVKPYKNGEKYGISKRSINKKDDEVRIFKTLEDAELYFDRMVNQKKKSVDLREEVNITNNYGKGGLLGESARLEYVTDAFSSNELRQELKDKLGIKTDKIGNNYVISFAFTDYGGDFLDKVAIEYFQENYPENTLVEPTGWNGQNAYVFGEPAKEWIETTEDYPLGFEDIEDFYYEKQTEQEQEDFNYFLDEISDKYEFDKEEALEWLNENRGGYYGMTTQGLDFSYEDLIQELLREGVIEKIEEEEYAGGGSVDDDLEKLEEIHEKIREILIESGGEEYGDFIIDDISRAVGISDTNSYYDEDEEYVKPTKVILKGNASKKDLEKLEEVHEQIREILIENGYEEYGDAIIDDISRVVGIPTTNAYYDDGSDGIKYEKGGEAGNVKYFYVKGRNEDAPQKLKDTYGEFYKENELIDYLNKWSNNESVSFNEIVKVYENGNTENVTDFYMKKYAEGGEAGGILKLYLKDEFSEKDSELIDEAIENGDIDTTEIKEYFLSYAYDKLENDVENEGNEEESEKIREFLDEMFENLSTHKQNYKNLISYLENNDEYAEGGSIELKTWREDGVSENEKFDFNSLTRSEVKDILKELGYKVTEDNFNKLHKKEHFDYIKEKDVFYRNDINNKYADGGNEPYAKRIYSKTSWEKITKFLNKIYTEEQTDLILHSKLMRYPEKETFEGFVDFFWKYEEKFDELLKENGLEDKDEEEFAEGGEVQEWMDEALESLIEETGYDDLEITIVSNDGNEFIATDGSTEYRVFVTENEAQITAEYEVYEDLKESPENFNQDFLLNHIDGRNFFESALEEMNIGYVEDIESESDSKYANRLIDELVENGLMDKDDAQYDNAEEVANDLKSDYVDLLTEQQLEEGNDGFDYFVSNFGLEYTMKLVFDNNLIDIEDASTEAVATDGIAHFLSYYDGETLYLSDDCVAYRTN